jgi:diguanylate cyclase (GGDEF)-like protein
VRLITRSDSSLAVGLVVGAIVAFQQPLHFLLEVARDVEVRYHLDLLPAVTIMTGVFIFHQYRKRLLVKAEAFAASAEAARARKRSEELEELMTFGRDLAGVLDVATLQQVLSKHLPTFAHERAFWVLARVDRRWQEVLQDTTRRSRRSMDELELMADLAVSKGALSAAPIEGISDAEGVIYPLLAGKATVGVLGIDDGTAVPPEDRKAIGAAAALIAIALRNVQVFGETQDYSVRDQLTGCFNRGHCLEILDRELRRAKRSGRPLSIVMLDIDHFKTFNDELGHLRGDEILRAVGAQLTRVLRTTDVSCRYGGDEFLIILPDTPLLGAGQVAETLRLEIAKLALATATKRVLDVTASVGLAAAAPAELDVAALIKRADEALYRAKHAGRNRVQTAAPPAAPSETESQTGDPMAPASRPGEEVMGTETILVADDEPLAHELIRRALKPRGYTILSAKNAGDAIAVGEAHRGPIHLLLTDIVMPGLLGPELALHIRHLRPDIKVLFVSGFMDHLPVDLSSLVRDEAFLEKPFTPNALAARIRKELDS